MNFLHKALKAINEIPKPVKTFASKALVLLIVWQVVYLGFLAPTRIIDKPLSMFTGNATAWCVKKLMPGHSIVVKEVLQMGAKGFVPKKSAGEHIVNAVYKVSEGNQYFTDDIKEKMMQKIRSDETNQPRLFGS